MTWILGVLGAMLAVMAFVQAWIAVRDSDWDRAAMATLALGMLWLLANLEVVT